MRRLLDVLVILTVAAVAVGVMSARQSRQLDGATAQGVQGALKQLYERASYHGALERTHSTTGTLWPAAVEPKWFTAGVPINALLLADQLDHPWIDVAPPGDQSIHPPDPVALRSEQAQFWYNPNIGVFRARVSGLLSDVDALVLYNQMNAVELAQLQRDMDPARQPLAYTPGQAPGLQFASQIDVAQDSAGWAIEQPSATGLFESDLEPWDQAISPVGVLVSPARRATLKDRVVPDS